VKRIAILLFAFSFAAFPARADGIKAVASTLGIAGISSILCTLTVLYSPEDEASESEEFDRRGFFIGAGASFAGENFSDRPVNDIADIFSNQPGLVFPIVTGPEATAKADDSWSVKGRAGYRCHPRYSIGATLEYFGGFDTEWSGALNPAGASGSDIDMLVATVDIKAYLLTGRYQPYLLMGGGIMLIETRVVNPTGSQHPWGAGPAAQSRDYTDFVLRLGAGVDAYATDHVVVNIGGSYLLPAGEVSGADVYTVGIGVEYRF
jgi:opacity protein-like surface antigen